MTTDTPTRYDIAFPSDGLILRGWFFIPSGDTPASGWPAVVAAEGFAGVKEIALDMIGRAYADAGIATIAFDYPYFGASDGQPRQLIDPEAQVRAYRNAIAYAASRPDIDGSRIGAWGASFAGGHVLRLAATPSGLKAVVAVVPHMHAGVAGRLPAALRHPLALLNTRYPVVSRDQSRPAIMQDESGYRFLIEDVARRVPTWRNWIDIRSIPKIAQYVPVDDDAVPEIPIRYIVASGDVITSPIVVRSLAATTTVENDLIELPGAHFDIYGPAKDAMLTASVEWLRDRL